MPFPPLAVRFTLEPLQISRLGDVSNVNELEIFKPLTPLATSIT